MKKRTVEYGFSTDYIGRYDQLDGEFIQSLRRSMHRTMQRARQSTHLVRLCVDLLELLVVSSRSRVSNGASLNSELAMQVNPNVTKETILDATLSTTYRFHVGIGYTEGTEDPQCGDIVIISSNIGPVASFNLIDRFVMWTSAKPSANIYKAQLELAIALANAGLLSVECGCERTAEGKHHILHKTVTEEMVHMQWTSANGFHEDGFLSDAVAKFLA